MIFKRLFANVYLLPIVSLITAIIHFIIAHLFSYSCTLNINSGLSIITGAGAITLVNALVVLALAICVMVWWKRFDGYFRSVIITIVVAGSGNLLDRVMLGGVCDYFAVPNLTIFNLNDILITLCIILLIYGTIRTKKN